MRMVWVGLLVVVCLAVIAVPALVPVSQPVSVQARTEREPFRLPFRFDSPAAWLGLSPFGPRIAGWEGILSAAASWVYLYLTSVLLLALFPRRVRFITQGLKSSGWTGRLRFFVIGFLATLASVLLVLLARHAFVWGALVILLSGGMFALAFLGVLAVNLMLGGAIRRWARLAPSLWIELALGSLILFAVGRIPLAGWVCVAIVAAWGLGAVLATHLGSGEAWSLRDWQTEG